MACGSCSKRRQRNNRQDYDVMGGYKHLPDRQLKARLETYKKMYCKSCDFRYNCDFVRYSNCNVKKT